MEDELYFGKYIRQKRLEKHTPALDIARYLGISNPHWCDIEKGRRKPPELEKLEELAKFLKLTNEERATMLDLAGKYSGQPAEDISQWIMAVPGLSAALRTAKENKLEDGEDWNEMVNEMIRRRNLKEK